MPLEGWWVRGGAHHCFDFCAIAGTEVSAHGPKVLPLKVWH